jgi:hypothetical protein
MTYAFATEGFLGFTGDPHRFAEVKLRAELRAREPMRVTPGDDPVIDALLEKQRRLDAEARELELGYAVHRILNDELLAERDRDDDEETYRADFLKFAAWCTAEKLGPSLPSTHAVVSYYLVTHAMESPEQLQRAWNAIRFYHEWRGTPLTETIEIRAALRWARRHHEAAQAKAEAAPTATTTEEPPPNDGNINKKGNDQ